MKLFKRKTTPPCAAEDRLARILADLILRYQSRLSSRMNAWINRYSVRSQKRMLWSFCLLAACGLTTSLSLRFHQPDMRSRRNNMPRQSGRPSDLPKPARYPHKFKDSLTTKH